MLCVLLPIPTPTASPLTTLSLFLPGEAAELPGLSGSRPSNPSPSLSSVVVSLVLDENLGLTTPTGAIGISFSEDKLCSDRPLMTELLFFPPLLHPAPQLPPPEAGCVCVWLAPLPFPHPAAFLFSPAQTAQLFM